MELYETLKILLLAVLQGIGEFLPISSSGHLLVAGKLLFGDSGALDDGGFLALGVLLHAGTLLSILVVFRQRIIETLTVNRRLIGLVIAGSIPTAAIGFYVERKMMFLVENLTVAGIGFLLTGVLLLLFLRNRTSEQSISEGDTQNGDDTQKDGTISNAPSEEKTLRTMTLLDALWIGVFQGIAVLPGCSRSGFTIAAGRMRRLRREDAAVFSFFLAIPAIGGVALLEAIKLFREPAESAAEAAAAGGSNFALYALGFTVSFAVGIAALIWLMKWLAGGKLYRFAWWLFPLGAAVLAWQFFGG